MRRNIKTVKGQVTLIMIAFSLIVAILITAYGVYLTGTYQRNITVQSVEFNLQLVANLIEQDLRDLSSLAKWCSAGNNAATDYFSDLYSNDKMKSIQAYNRVSEEMNNNRARLYVRRLIMVSNSLDKILQIDNYPSASKPLNIYSINMLEGLKSSSFTEWETIVTDPFYITPGTEVMTLMSPVYHPTNRSRIGTVFLAANTTLITDKLAGYKLPENSALYVSVGEKHYRIDNNTFKQAPFEYEMLKYDTNIAISNETSVYIAQDPNGDKHTLVAYPVRKGLALIQVLSQEQHYPQGGTWILMLLALVCLIIVLALFVIYYLDRNISRPVAKLRHKIEVIANGDFSADPTLEFDNELGEVGCGVNKLSHDIVALMENRIRDEHQKRDLEYRMLQSQMNPHFLYNTLGSIKWMATLQGVTGIAEMVTSLSRLLKTIAKDIRKIVTLKDELSLLEDYLIIQKYRYGNNVTITTNISDPRLLDTHIPRFTLQPLVENAIFHGIEPKGAGNIWLDAIRDGFDVLITVTDDGIGMSDELFMNVFTDAQGDTSGIFAKLGLRSVNERLLYTFGEGYGLSYKSEKGKYTTMTIRLPVTDAEGVHNGKATDSR